MYKQLETYYGYLFEPILLKEISEVAIEKHIEEGDEIIGIGSYIKYIPLILDGAIKVLRNDSQGDDLLLYFLEKGDTCAMTMACCMGRKKSEIKAVAETPCSLLLIPVEYMMRWMSKYPTWQQFILQSYQDRMSEMLEAIDTLAFSNLDSRLLKYLKDKAMVNRNEEIQVTHSEIANDLHTSRVVVSRLLKSLELKEEIKLNRNQITVLNL
ncbi:Crp/Fnr family transcriptional regulator [Pseudotenacibaculum haliotis]|uniref:Crp/Fnr family transcriptional regulator n=1 Tax=Pseudotenacibaculum haliotis TaxID=1862138 RepID=A0ABW5LRA8_9FLAO